MPLTQPPLAPPMYPNLPPQQWVNMMSHPTVPTINLPVLTGPLSTFCSRSTYVDVVNPDTQMQWKGNGKTRVEVVNDCKDDIRCFALVTTRDSAKYFIFGHTNGKGGIWQYVTAVKTAKDEYTVEFRPHDIHPRNLQLNSAKNHDMRLFSMDDDFLIPAFDESLCLGIVPNRKTFFLSLAKDRGQGRRWKVIHKPKSEFCVVQ